MEARRRIARPCTTTHSRAVGPGATHGQTHSHASDRAPTHGCASVGPVQPRDFLGYLMRFIFLLWGGRLLLGSFEDQLG